MLSFLGGLALFGPTGMILGPAILAMTVAVLDVWRRRPTPKEIEQTLVPA
jgi:predicted PurR-regulated permease PerM